MNTPEENPAETLAEASPASTPAPGEAPAPAEPAEPDAPADSAEQAKPTEPTKAAEPADSAEVAMPTEAANAAEPDKATGPAPTKKKRRRRRKKPSSSAPAQAPAGNRSRPDKNRSGQAPGGGRQTRHHAFTALRSLSAMTQGLLEVEGIDLLSRPRYVDITVRVPLDIKRDGQKAAADTVEQIFKRVHEVREHDKALVPGSVYCYFNETASAEGCRPDHARKVFDSYSSTGRPQFTDFLTMAIERKDAGVEELAQGSDAIVTHVSMGRLLRTQQLAEFGKASPVFRILGQVDAGLYPLLNSAEKAAFSFQVLRGATLEGKPRFRLHPIGAADLSDLADPSVALILSRYQRRLDSEALRLAGLEANGNAPGEEDFVLPLLEDLAKQLKGRARHAGRRTGHADQRSIEGQRPTAKASEDAARASDDQILMDDAKGTIVVLGPRGRVHVFSPEALHVTSLMMTGANISKRRKEGRWNQAEPEERGEFRILLKQHMQAESATEEPPKDDAQTPSEG